MGEVGEEKWGKWGKRSGGSGGSEVGEVEAEKWRKGGKRSANEQSKQSARLPILDDCRAYACLIMSLEPFAHTTFAYSSDVTCWPSKQNSTRYSVTFVPFCSLLMDHPQNGSPLSPFSDHRLLDFQGSASELMR